MGCNMVEPYSRRRVSDSQHPRQVRRYWRVLGALLLVAGCQHEVSPEEIEFRVRASGVEVGSSMVAKRRDLGPPSLIAAAEGECSSAGAKRQWIYKDFEHGGRRISLDGNFLIFCTNSADIVVAVLSATH